MAHFAKIDQNNVVVDVIVVNNEDILDENGNESEQVGIEFLNNLLGEGNWVQTSYNGNFRYNYAEVGGTYDPQADAFIPVKEFASWVLNTETYQWEPPFPYTGDTTKAYYWDEPSQSYVIEQMAP